MPYSGHTLGYLKAKRRRDFELGRISRQEYEEGTAEPYSSAKIIRSRKAARSKYQTAGEKIYREIPPRFRTPEPSEIEPAPEPIAPLPPTKLRRRAFAS